MNLRELNKGNLIGVPLYGVVRVKCLVYDDAKVIVSDDGRTVNVNVAECVPVPATQERLLKLGFVQDRYDVRLVAYRDILLLQNAIGDYFLFTGLCSVGQPLRYMHQIQNLVYILRGEEL